MKKISLDFETFSECDIKKAGAWVYSKDKSTRVICMAYAVDDQAPNIWLPKDRYPDFLILFFRVGNMDSRSKATDSAYLSMA